MSAHDEPLVEILVPKDEADRVHELACSLSSKGLLVVVQPIDVELEKSLDAIAGGVSPQAAAIVVDLGDASTERAKGVLKHLPQLAERMYVVGKRDPELERRKVRFCERSALAGKLESLVKR